MPYFRKRPVVIEAVRFTGNNAGEIRILVGEEVCVAKGDRLLIGTLEGDMTASPGDWIIKGVSGEGYPCRDDIFRRTYEPVPGER